VPTAGHERKHNACRAEIGGCVSDYTYISRVKGPQNVCRGSVEECNQAQAGTGPQNQAQGRQARDRRAEAALAGYLYVLDPSVSGPNTVGPISIGRTSNTCELRHYHEAQLCVQAAVLPNTASQPAHLSVYGFTGATSACSACVAPVTATGL